MRRTMLFLPGNTPNMLINGDMLGADSIILDLEDAVDPGQKDAARILVRNALKRRMYKKSEVIVRINPIESDYWEKDIEETVPYGPALLMPAKVSSGEDVKIISEYMAKVEQACGMEVGTVGLLPLIETAKGVEHAYEIASADKRVVGLFLGGEDLTADLHAVRTEEGAEILYARSRILYAARACQIEAYDTPFTNVNDDDGALRDAQVAKSMGFSGKASISPRHVDIINGVFSPTEKEIQYAHLVMEAIAEGKKQGKGAVSLFGKMIDAPIVKRAQQVLEMEKEIYGGDLSE